jgi:hypothetical protein
MMVSRPRRDDVASACWGRGAGEVIPMSVALRV